MQTDYKIEEEITDKKSQGSCKLSRSRKIKKSNQKNDRPEKQKEKTPKITNFFKKLAHDNFQRPRNSSQKKQQKRSPQQEQRISELQNQQKDLQHEQELLKRQIQTLKSEQQIMNEQLSCYMRKLRQSEILDLKQRYQIIRIQKNLPDIRKVTIQSVSNIRDQSQKDKESDLLTPQIKEIMQKISQRQRTLLNASSISLIQKINLQKDVKNLQTQLEFLHVQNQQYQEKLLLSEKQKTCKFAKLNWPLIHKRYQTLELIESGGYSQVYKAINLSNNQTVAIKLCSVAQMAQMSPQVYLKHLFRQCETHKSLNHENIVKLYQVIEMDKNTFCLILQFCQGPQLSKHLKRKGSLSESQAKSIMFQIFETLFYLSICTTKKIVHYDLKPQNIMFHQGLIKILDFGLNKQLEEQQSRAALTSVGLGTHAYLPPEIHQYDPEDDRVLSNKVDIWSSGIIFYQLLNGKRPTKIQDIQFIDAQNSNFNTKTIEIIKMCLKLNPSQRINPQQVYFHQYFDGFQRKYQKQNK